MKALYRPILAFDLRFRKEVVALSLIILDIKTYLSVKIEAEFMPSRNEGDLL